MQYKFLHFSDSHQATAAESQALSIISSAGGSYIPVYTGDFSYQDLPDGHNSNILANCFCVVGNHDRMLTPYSINPTLADSGRVHSEYFSSGYTVSKATFANVPNSTYWHYDVDNGLRLIGLDCTLTNYSEINQERSWLSDLLQRTNSEGKKAVVLSHILPRGRSPYRSTFTDIAYWVYSKWYLSGSYEDPASKDFKSCIDSLDTVLRQNTGTIAFMLYGHEHSDGFFTNAGFPEFVIGDTWTGDMGAYNNVNRSDADNAKDMLVMNYYIYDTNENTIAVYRLGADHCYDGTRRKMMVVDRRSNRVISDCSSV